MNSTNWKTMPTQTQLSELMIHVWKADLDQFAVYLQSAESILSFDEIEKARRFYFEHDRNRYIAARSTLRILLGLYLDVEPGLVSFQYNDYGKPFVGDELGRSPIQFNVSHSQNFALFAFGERGEIGVDIEFVRPSFVSTEIAERFFSRDEVKELGGIPDDEKVKKFFNCWTRKEAYIKAKGKGLSLPLDSFSVDLLSESRCGINRSSYYPDDAHSFSIYPIQCGDNCRAALALNKKQYSLAHYTVDPELIWASNYLGDYV